MKALILTELSCVTSVNSTLKFRGRRSVSGNSLSKDGFRLLAFVSAAFLHPQRLRHFSRLFSAIESKSRSNFVATLATYQSRSPNSSAIPSLKSLCASPSRRCFFYSVRSDPTSPTIPRRGTISSVPLTAGI